jgi:hypothetical protein
MSYKSLNTMNFDSNPLFPIKMGEDKIVKKNVNNLLNKTKGLILSNKNYNNFMKKYLILTQVSSFKLPEISNYPILKNDYNIPIARTTFTTKNDKNIIFSALNKNSKKKQKDKDKEKPQDKTKAKDKNNDLFKLNDISDEKGNITTKNKNIKDNLFNNNNNNPNENDKENNNNDDNNENENNNNNNYFSKNFYALRDKKLLDESEISIRSIVNKISELKLNNNDFLYLNKADGKFKQKSTDSGIENNYNNKNNLIEINELLEYTKNYYLTKNYKTLILSLLCDFQFCIKIFDYEKLIKNNFDEKCIDFNEKNKSEIEEILLKLIEKITENSHENLTYELKKSYEVLDGKKLDLKISSILLEFTEIRDYNEKIINLDGDGNIDNENLKSKKNYFTKTISIPFSLLPVFYYSSFDSFFIFLSKIISRNKSEKEKDPKKNNENLNKNKNEEKENEHYKEPIEIKFDSIRDIIKSFKEFILENKCYDKDFSIEKTITWIADDKEFLIKIIPPKIEFSLDDNSFYIGKNIPKDILIFFILKNFINWDFFILNYLSRFKIFRDNLNERFYKRMRDFNKNKIVSNKTTDLKDLRIANFDVDFIHIIIDEKIPEISIENSIVLNFLFTNNQGETFYLKLDSYKLNISLNLENNNPNNNHNPHHHSNDNYLYDENDIYNNNYIIHKNFNFSLNQLIKLEKLKKFYDLKIYLKKMVIIMNNKEEKETKINNHIHRKTNFNHNHDNLFNDKKKLANKIGFDLDYFETLDDNFFKFLVKNENDPELENDYNEKNNSKNHYHQMDFELK